MDREGPVVEGRPGDAAHREAIGYGYWTGWANADRHKGGGQDNDSGLNEIPKASAGRISSVSSRFAGL